MNNYPSSDDRSADKRILELKSVSKKYGNTTALKPLDFHLKSGEVQVLFGENGAGKSTLISMIAGVHQPTTGAVFFAGNAVNISSVKQARELGICAVFQEFSLVPQLTVAQNMFLGNEICSTFSLNNKRMHSKALEILEQLEFDLKPDEIVANLPRAGQQMVEIAKAFCSEVSVLILDEPTASLTDHETQQLFKLVKRLKKRGVGIIYITHRLAEIRQISDRVTVLRDGELIGSLATSSLNEDSLVQMMTGQPASEVFPKINFAPGKLLLEIKNLTANSLVKDISLQLKAGEVVGLAGLIGSGKSELAEICYGLTPYDSGQVIIDGQIIEKLSPRNLIDAGLYYCPPDRRETGLIMADSIAHNLTLNALTTNKFSHSLSKIIKSKNELESVNQLMSKLSIKADSSKQHVASLSGGNQQKILIAKALARKFKVFVFDEPTVGVDVTTRKVIYQFIAKLCEQGAAVLLISSDLPEIINLSHRVYVFSQGEIAKHLTATDITQQQVLSHFFGKVENAA